MSFWLYSSLGGGIMSGIYWAAREATRKPKTNVWDYDGYTILETGPKPTAWSCFENGACGVLIGAMMAPIAVPIGICSIPFLFYQPKIPVFE